MHYICTGSCHGESDQPGTCQAEGCEMHHKDLVACDCSDGKHQAIMTNDEEKTETKDQ